MEISKSAVLLANEHLKRPEEMLQIIFVTFSLCNRSRKNDSVIGMPENTASRRILTKMAASVCHRILSIITNIWIYTTRRSRLKTSLVHVVICF